MTPMEALLSGCAVLVNDDPSLRALGLGDGVQELAMSPDGLRRCLTELAHSPDAVRSLASRGSEVARTLPTWEQHLEALESLLRAAAERRSVPARSGS